MRTKKATRQTPKPASKNEWLSVVASLDELMAHQASDVSVGVRKTTLSKGLLATVNAAYAATLRYYTSLLEGGNRNPKAELEISRLWQKTGAGIRRCDPDLANRLKGSNAFWRNDVTWQRETIQLAWVRLNSIRANANVLSPDMKTVLRWSTFSTS